MYPPTFLTPYGPPPPHLWGWGRRARLRQLPGLCPRLAATKSAPCRPRAPAARRHHPRALARSRAALRGLPSSPPGEEKKKKLTSAVVSRHLPAPAPPLPSVGITPPFYLSITNCLLFCLTRTLSNNNKRQILLLCVTKTPFFFFSVELYSWSWQSERSLCVYFSRCLSLLSE